MKNFLSRKLLVSGACSSFAFAGFATMAAYANPDADQSQSSAATSALYKEQCAACHGQAFGGGFGPALKSDEFKTQWKDRSLAELGALIKATMPPIAPDSLSEAQSLALAEMVAKANDIALSKTPVAEAGQSEPAMAREAVSADGNATLADLGTRSDLNEVQYVSEMERRQNILDGIKPLPLEDVWSPDPANWSAWRRGGGSMGFSPLTQVNRDNVKGLTLAWSSSLSSGTNSISPLVHDGVMFIHASDKVLALDAASGTVLWEYKGSTENHGFVPSSQPRTMAMARDKLIVPMLDGHIVALNMKTGEAVWDQAVFEPEDGYQLTTGPVIAKDKVVQGVAGCAKDIPGGCYIIALDLETGKPLWKFNTIAAPGTPGGDSWNGLPADRRFGGSLWTPGSYSPETGLVYFGTGQTYMVSDVVKSAPKRGKSKDLLYTDSTLALDPDTGELAWHFQHLPGDVWDLDWPFERMVITIPGVNSGNEIVITGGKIGIFDALDAKTGKFLFSFDIGMQNLVLSVDPDTGDKEINPKAYFRPGGDLVELYPDGIGARNWPATAYDPNQNLLFIPSFENKGTYGSTTELPENFSFDIVIKGSVKEEANGDYGRLFAYDLKSRDLVWEKKVRAPYSSASLSTGGGVLFQGLIDRNFVAYDSATGEELWKVKLNESPSSFPLSYLVDGQQYVAVVTGSGTPVDVWNQGLVPEVARPSGARSVYVFKLPDSAK